MDLSPPPSPVIYPEGYFAYRYKGIYYRTPIYDGARPGVYGSAIVRKFPQDPKALKEYITQTTQMLQDQPQRAQLFEGNQCEVGTCRNWTLGSLSIDWTYVIDFDNCVLTVNGAVHFPFDKIPPLDGSESDPGFVEYLESDDRIEIPAKYLKTIDLWPAPRFDVTKARRQYSRIRPLTVALVEWGAPTWDSLSVSHHLAASIVKTLIHDYSDELALTHYSNVWHKIGLFCWQVANAAAPSHLICPPLDANPLNSVHYTCVDLAKEPWGSVRSIHRHINARGTLGRYCWFRGCLITFCPRLDEPSYMMHQASKMVEKLRKHGRRTGVGIIMSGWHVVAVAIDGSKVRHSPALEMHDGQELKDGVLLLMHLLSPTFTNVKAPWRARISVHQPPNAATTLPDDILRQIVNLTDLETYLSLRLVSRRIRLICLNYPRVGHHILLGYEGEGNSGSVFRVSSPRSTYSTVATLMRTKSSILKPYPIWKFGRKSYYMCALNPGLAGTFQYHQSGIRPLHPEAGGKSNDTTPYSPWVVRFRDVIKKDTHYDMRIQTVDGIWEMVAGTPAVEVPGEVYQWYSRRRMTGFEASEFDGMSEIEDRDYLFNDSRMLEDERSKHKYKIPCTIS
ncbi:putative CHD5 domain protein [Rhizoctonia solani 123E]|uniref:Putative CHD5 domain protein n=1 Tax=Rhizoctonia solani 123E TaxID=1423351 RepID=A0A074RKZ3_9AGAM|nr:putative CHD5 domain protein [Rhizoctonia solani 123E]